MTTNSSSPQDMAAVAAVPARIVQAWAEHDADAFAETFTADGTMILPGVLCTGRDEIRTFMADEFDGRLKGTRVTGQPIGVKFLGPDAALLITAGGVLAPGQSEVTADSAIRAQWTVVRTEGQWLLTAYQNSPQH